MKPRVQAARTTPRVGGRMTFTEVLPSLTEARSVLDAWGGWAGEYETLFVTSGEREGGGNSDVWRRDGVAGSWISDEAPTGPTAETINKIRSGLGRIWAFYERPGSGQTWLISKSEGGGPGGWSFEGVSSHGGPVGGRGLAIDGPDGDAVFGGATQNVNGEGPHDAEVYEGPGGWGLHRRISPSLMWELEFDGDGYLWEFYSDFGAQGEVSAVYVDGHEKGGAPGGDISHACWFDGYMYVIGNLASGGVRNAISRSSNGDSWETVHTFDSNAGDHVQVMPFDPPELWYTAHDNFQAGYSLDGTTWTREPSLPTFPTGADTNHLTAIAFWQGGVWILARDASVNYVRVFTAGGSGRSLMLQVI
jgi:hypothetical protein